MFTQETETLKSLEAEASKIVDQLKQMPIIGRILEKLRKDLPKDLRYHIESEEENGIRHSEDVLGEAILFAVADGQTDERFLELLGIAAVYHDAGFLIKYDANEDFGANMAETDMRETGEYEEDEIDMVTQAIKATKVELKDGILKQGYAPNLLAAYLLDADLGNFGRGDFRGKSELLFEELQLRNPQKPPNKDEFLLGTHNFIKNHEWHTKAAKRLRFGQEQLNIQNLGHELNITA